MEADAFSQLKHDLSELEPAFILTRNRCFLTLSIKFANKIFIDKFSDQEPSEEEYIRQIIHVPELRGNPERVYPVATVGSEFPGTFENYVASIIGQWQTDGELVRLEKVNQDLARLGLTRSVYAKQVNDTQVELLVSPPFKRDVDEKQNGINIADVGLGVSQTLPVVIALHAAKENQLIYLEQPEIHLHPRAQSKLAEVLANAALQGKRMVIETHSSLLLLGIQTLVAEGKLPPELVKLHWFTVAEDGSTQISSADLDETGAFGEWPEDFAQVSMDSEDRYLDAAQTPH